MKLDFTPHPDYLQVVAEGEFDLADSKSCVDSVYRLCDEHQYTKVLVDTRGIPANVSLASRFSLAEYIVAGYPRPIRIAMLCSTAQVEFTKRHDPRRRDYPADRPQGQNATNSSGHQQSFSRRE